MCVYVCVRGRVTERERECELETERKSGCVCASCVG